MPWAGPQSEVGEAPWQCELPTLRHTSNCAKPIYKATGLGQAAKVTNSDANRCVETHIGKKGDRGSRSSVIGTSVTSGKSGSTPRLTGMCTQILRALLFLCRTLQSNSLESVHECTSTFSSEVDCLFLIFSGHRVVYLAPRCTKWSSFCRFKSQTVKNFERLKVHEVVRRPMN